MNSCKNCNNCAWFCHRDGKCYGNNGTIYGHRTVPETVKLPYWNECRECEYRDYPVRCGAWSSDGLTDEERDAFMTMVGA